MADAQCKDAHRGHDAEMIGAHKIFQHFAVALDRIALRNFHRGPEAIAGPGCRCIGRADDDVSRERILLEHVVERGVEPFGRNLPGDESAAGEVGCHERLPHTANRPRLEHRADPFDDRGKRYARLFGNLSDRIAHEAGNPVLRDCENRSIDMISGADGNRGGSGLGHGG